VEDLIFMQVLFPVLIIGEKKEPTHRVHAPIIAISQNTAFSLSTSFCQRRNPAEPVGTLLKPLSCSQSGQQVEAVNNYREFSFLACMGNSIVQEPTMQT
jgi:hypothetical protein